MSHRETSAKIASLASRALQKPGSLNHDEIQQLAASCLSQREEDFDREDEIVIPVPEGHDIMEELPEAGGEIVDVGANGEDETPLKPDTVGAAEDLSPKVLTDAFVQELRGVVVPTRKTAVRMSEFVVSYLERLARNRAGQ